MDPIQLAIRFAWYLTTAHDTLIVHQGVVIRLIQLGRPLGDHRQVEMVDADTVVVRDGSGRVVWPPESREAGIPKTYLRRLREVDQWLESIDIIKKARLELHELLSRISPKSSAFIDIAVWYANQIKNIPDPELRIIMEHDCVKLFSRQTELKEWSILDDPDSHIWGETADSSG